MTYTHVPGFFNILTKDSSITCGLEDDLPPVGRDGRTAIFLSLHSVPAAH